MTPLSCQGDQVWVQRSALMPSTLAPAAKLLKHTGGQSREPGAV